MTIDFDADDFKAFVIAPQADLPQEGQGKEAEHQQTNLREEHAKRIGFDLLGMKDQAVLQGLRQDNAQSMPQARQDHAGADIGQDDAEAHQDDKAIAPQADLPVGKEKQTQDSPSSPNCPGIEESTNPLDSSTSPSNPLDHSSLLDSSNPLNPSKPLENAENAGNCSVTGSDIDLESATRNQLIELIEELRHDIVRLNRRIHELGGNPPKRDRAAYMRQYRSRLKGAMSGKAPDLGVKFV